jgi:Cu/Ag efflux pump CusA
LRNPLCVVVLILSVLLAGFLAFKNVQSGFTPKMDEGGFIVDYRAPPETSPGFQPWEAPTRPTRPERAREMQDEKD